MIPNSEEFSQFLNLYDTEALQKVLPPGYGVKLEPPHGPAGFAVVITIRVHAEHGGIAKLSDSQSSIVDIVPIVSLN